MDPKQATVLVGTNYVTGEGGQEYKVAYLIQHEDYVSEFLNARREGGKSEFNVVFFSL